MIFQSKCLRMRLRIRVYDSNHRYSPLQAGWRSQLFQNVFYVTFQHKMLLLTFHWTIKYESNSILFTQNSSYSSQLKPYETKSCATSGSTSHLNQSTNSFRQSNLIGQSVRGKQSALGVFTYNIIFMKQYTHYNV